MRVAMIAPNYYPAENGNAVTVRRIERQLRLLGCEVQVFPVDRMVGEEILAGVKAFAPQLLHAFHGYHGGRMANALAQELATKGVTVNTVSPGYIGTDMVKGIRQDVLDKIIATVPVKRLGEPSEIALIIAWVASDEGGYSTGADFSVNGGLHMG